MQPIAQSVTPYSTRSFKHESTKFQLPIEKTNHANIHLPFPIYAPITQKEMIDKELWELFNNMDINILLIKVIHKSRQVPKGVVHEQAVEKWTQAHLVKRECLCGT